MTAASFTLPNLGLAAEAVRSVVAAVSDAGGLDCLHHAVIGSELLRRLGVPDARIALGVAAWRVGRGDGDVITHAPQGGQMFRPDTAGPALAFHAWIESPGSGVLVDFTTYMLRTKAALLDQADGGTTEVIWCPQYLTAPLRGECAHRLPSLDRVAQAPDAGVFWYQEVPGLEALLFDAPARATRQFAQWADMAYAVYVGRARGSQMRVVGLGADGMQSTAPIRPVIPVPRAITE